MLRKLCIVCVGFALCFGMLGCGGDKTEMPKEKVAQPAAKPGNMETPE